MPHLINGNNQISKISPIISSIKDQNGLEVELVLANEKNTTNC